MSFREALALSSLYCGALAGSLAQQPVESLLPAFEAHFESISDYAHESCKISRIGAFETAVGPVNISTSTTEHLESSKLTPSINSTAWEQWEFDGTSLSGTAGLIMGFSRDPSYAFFGQGNLRVEFYMLLEDGTVIQELDYLSQSTIIDCEDSVTGVWNSSDRNYSFHIPKDMSRANVWWDTGRQKGSLLLESHAPAHLADGLPWPLNSSAVEVEHQVVPTVSLAPSLYYNSPIPGGRITAALTVGKNKRLEFTGVGGHGRLWASAGWFDICDGWHIVRASVGPYTLSLWEPISRLNRGVSYYSAQLFRDGQLVLATQKGHVSTTDDFVLYTPLQYGNLSGGLAERSTGRVVELVSPRRGKIWRFVIKHHRKQFEMGLGGGKGLTGFLDRVHGGEEDSAENFQGVGWSEQVSLPDEIKKWQIWVVYGIGLLGQWRHSLLAVISKYI